MKTETELSLNTLKAMQIMQDAQAKGWVSEEEHQRIQGELHNLGFDVAVMSNPNEEENESPTDDDGRTITEISVSPVVVQVADENGLAVKGQVSTAFKGIYSGKFGNKLDSYPDSMFKKWWSVTLWAEDDWEDGEGSYPVEDEDFVDRETAVARAEELATLYRVAIDRQY